MFAIEILPAEEGDCLWLSWGENPVRHLLIDGGPRDESTAHALRATMARELTGRGARLELLVVTHIDGDHIAGVIGLLGQPKLPKLADVWFNGREHHVAEDQLGAVQAEEVSRLLLERGLPWNKAFGGKAVVIPEDPDAPLPAVKLPGGLRLTVLGPTRERMRQLLPKWDQEVAEAEKKRSPRKAPPPDVLGGDLDIPHLAARKFKRDPSRANGASITLLAEYEGSSLLLTGDAYGDDVAAALARLARERDVERVPINVCKLPHHGSRANVSTGFVDAVRARHYLVSSSGRQHNHPDKEAIARVLLQPGPKKLSFNYRVETTEVWANPLLRREHRYTTVFPRKGQVGLRAPL